MLRLFMALACAMCMVLMGCGASKSDIELAAKDLTQKIINENEALKNLGMVVEHVDAIRESENKYQGLAKVKLDGETHQVAISILADGDKVLVTTEGGAFAFAASAIVKKALESATQQMQALAAPSIEQTNQMQETKVQEPASPQTARETVMPSFDCAKASSTSERLICADPDLSTLDAEMASLYARAKSASVDKVAFNDETKARWKQRESECFDKSCLIAWYTLRKGELQAWLPH